MGSGVEFNCSKCGNSYRVYTGVGMLFPVVYEDTMKRILDGGFGEEWKNLAGAYEFSAVNCEDELYRCKCGHWEVMQVLDLYKPKNVEILKKKLYGTKTAEEWGYVPYVYSEELKNDYDLVKKYTHICPECGREMKKSCIRFCFKNEDMKGSTKLKCPECGTYNPPDPHTVKWD